MAAAIDSGPLKRGRRRPRSTVFFGCGRYVFWCFYCIFFFFFLSTYHTLCTNAPVGEHSRRPDDGVESPGFIFLRPLRNAGGRPHRIFLNPTDFSAGIYHTVPIAHKNQINSHTHTRKNTFRTRDCVNTIRRRVGSSTAFIIFFLNFFPLIEIF